MKLHNIVTKTRSGAKIAAIDYLSGEVYINDIEVSKLLENSEYFKHYREREVYAIEIENGVMNIEII